MCGPNDAQSLQSGLCPAPFIQTKSPILKICECCSGAISKRTSLAQYEFVSNEETQRSMVTGNVDRREYRSRLVVPAGPSGMTRGGPLPRSSSYAAPMISPASCAAAAMRISLGTVSRNDRGSLIRRSRLRSRCSIRGGAVVADRTCLGDFERKTLRPAAAAAAVRPSLYKGALLHGAKKGEGNG